ncbi:MAG TPA: CopG family transcriptional regulator [Bacteroidales bacterium]|nr:CopG family transcriptional regulator [Bacteroidales bacterium]
MTSDRINARLPLSLAQHVEKMINDFYETPSEYIRDLIRRDMEKIELYKSKELILEGYKNASQGKYFKSSGDFKNDLKEFNKKKNTNW